MNYRTIAVVLCCLAWTSGSFATAQDWPQWRGPHRDGKAASFAAPESWPKELIKKWTVNVGEGVATPALVGDRLYVFSRQDGKEIVRCLSAATGDEIWQDSYAADPVRPPANRVGGEGPRSSPAVADGKVVTLGVHGTLSCLDAATGEVVWRNDSYEGATPRFETSSSPIVVDGLCIAQLGDESSGGIFAFDLSTGDEKWAWKEDGPAYGSPASISIGDAKAIIAPTSKNMVILRVDNGKLMWKVPYTHGRYNATTPIVHGQTVVYAGPNNRGSTAERIVPAGDEANAEELWANAGNSLNFNTPVFRDGSIFGVSTTNSLFCVNVDAGETTWDAPVGAESGQAGGERGEGARANGGGQARDGNQRRGGRGRRGRGGGFNGYGSVVDAGSVLLALTPASELIVFEPNSQEYSEVAKYKVADSPTFAYPVVSGNRIFVKDSDSVILWTIN